MDRTVKIHNSGITITFFDRNCWQNYVDFHRCQKVKGDGYEPCQYFYHVYRDICPTEWVEKWNEQREKGTFPVKL